MDATTIVLIVVAAVILLIAIWLISFYNRMLKTREQIENSWGQINVQLKMRADLIPNLVETVSGYAAHESKTLEQITDARTRYLSAKTPADAMNASGELTRLVSRLFAVAEQYPDLKANQNFLQLQSELTDLEKKIATYRQFYNDVVLRFNRLIITFPNNIAASLFHAQQMPYFEVTEEEKAVPKVSFQ